MMPRERISTSDFIEINAADTVGVALVDFPRSACLSVRGLDIVLCDDIPVGHKFSLQHHGFGEEVIKYGGVIGKASKVIEPGEHVHSHNLGTSLAGIEQYVYRESKKIDSHTDLKKNQTVGFSKALSGYFQGYKREDGRVGTRNEIWIIPTVGCVARVAENIAMTSNARHKHEVDGVYAFPHPFGCSQLGKDLSSTQNILTALAANPNAGGVVFIGLGCESNQLEALLDSAPFLDRKRIRSVISQNVGDEVEAGLAAVEALVSIASQDMRQQCAVSDLVVGVKCGGSDGFSGLTANPLVGLITDRLTRMGGASILTEIPEIFGAEKTLLARCLNENIFDKFVSIVNDFKTYFFEHDQPIYENPSPGNIEGGITTLEEKSMGAVQKAGTSSIVCDALRYGERTNGQGLSLLEAPGNDAVSSTALAAAGATVILFTTGRGTPLGFPVPVIKISSNKELSQKKERWIDFDASTMLADDGAEATQNALWDLILRTASGKLAMNEINNERSIAIWKRGVTL